MKYSIIITAYNSESYIKRCLDSIINQTVKNFTLIVIDDGSTDDTKKIVKSYIKKYKFIEYYYKENGGTAHSRNFGVSKVKTPYFLFVDSDDYIALDLMETVEKYDNYDILSFKSLQVNDDGKVLKKLEKEVFDLIDGQSYLKALIRGTNWFVVPWGYVYNKKFWDKHNFKYANYHVLEDTSGTPIILINAETIISIDYYGYYYVQTEESTYRTSTDKKIKTNTTSYLFHYDTMIDYINKFDCTNEFKKIFYEHVIFCMLYYGAKLPNRYLKSYCKELEKRNLIVNLEPRDSYLRSVIFLCNLSYKLFIFKLKIDAIWEKIIKRKSTI